MIDVSTVRTVHPEGMAGEGTTVRYTAYSIRGSRESQQDSLFVGERAGAILAVVCDGMGGMDGGERASGLAIRMMAEAFYEQNQIHIPSFFRDMALKMDEAVYGLEDGRKRLGAGTTIVAVLVRPEGLYWLSVGDSRLYLYRQGQMLCPVAAHNYRLLLDQMFAKGKLSEEKYRREMPKSEALVSYLGLGGISRMEINRNPFRLERGDQVLLCSDGLYKSLSDGQILDILNLRMSLEIKAKYMVDRAMESGGRCQDNTSVVLLQA